MKKITKLGFVLLIATVIMGSTAYAAFDCNVSMKTAKSEFTKNEEFVVSINLSNIQSEKGVIAFGATVEYDKDILTLVKMEGKGEWSNPSYNETNGKFVMDRNGVTTSNETVLQITFKVKENSKQNTTITLKDVSVSDGTTPIKKISSINKKITIKQETSTNDTTSNTTTDNNKNQASNANNTNESTNSNKNTNQNASSTNGSTNSNKNTNQNTSSTNESTNSNKNTSNTNGSTNSNNNTSTIKDDNTVSTVGLPKTGNNNVIIKLFLVAALIIVVYSYIRVRSKIQK